MNKKILAFLFLSIPSINAYAAWETKTEDDLFNGGKSAMMIAPLNAQAAIAFDCTKESLKMAYLEAEKDPSVSDIQVNMIVKVDSNEILKFSAKPRVRNNQAIEIYTDQEDVAKVLSQLKAAKSKFQLGIAIPGTEKKSSLSTGVTGSTNAVNSFVDACEIKLQ